MPRFTESDVYGGDPDPLDRLERNQRQARLAMANVAVSLGLVLLVLVGIVLAFELTESRCPDGAPLCLSESRWEIFVIPVALSILLSIRMGLHAYGAWKHRVRWRPWLFANYAMWIGTTGVLILSGTLAFRDGVAVG